MRRTDTGPGVGAFEVELGDGKEARRLTVRPAEYLWDPAAYTEAATTLLGADARGEAGEPIGTLEKLLLESDTPSLRRADKELFAALARRPRDARLHEQAALLWAAHALRETDGSFSDERPFVNGLVAHLALARSLGAGVPPGRDAEIAAIVLDATLGRQVEAMQSLDRLAEATKASGATNAWVTSLRMRITGDPRLAPPRGSASGLERREGIRALNRSRGCRAAVAQARSWGLRPSADWVRAIVGRCSEPEASQLTAVNMDLQVGDAGSLLDLPGVTMGEVLPAVAEASAADDQDVKPPASVVSAAVRANTGARHIVAALVRYSVYIRRRGVPQESQLFAIETAQVRAQLPQAALVDFLLERAADIKSPEACPRVTRLAADRPDQLPPEAWLHLRQCNTEPLFSMIKDTDFGLNVTPGTGRLGQEPWQPGLPVIPGIAEACRRAPWDTWLADRALLFTFKGNPPGKEVLAAYEKVLEYDVGAMQAALNVLYGEDDEAQRLAERICDIDVERCASYADHLASLDREGPAERMWKRALAASTDSITLSNELGQYVNILFDRGDTQEAMRVAKLAAGVYSGGGLFTLGNLYERLGKYDDAVAQYRKITARYESKNRENTFYIRYGQRHGGDRFQQETALALAEVFPGGLVRRSLAEFQTGGHRGGVFLDDTQLWTTLRRFGVRSGDMVVAVDGFAVSKQPQIDAILTFTDDPMLSVVVYRAGVKVGRGFVEVKGPYRRWKYGPVAGRSVVP